MDQHFKDFKAICPDGCLVKTETFCQHLKEKTDESFVRQIIYYITFKYLPLIELDVHY